MKSTMVLLLIVLYLSGCSKQEPSQAIKRSDAILIYGIPQAPTSLDPATATDLIYYQITFNIFETLIAIDWATSEFIPVLARSWQSDSTGLRWRFSLRQGVVFHDGSPLNAEAVKISFERQYDESSPYFRRNVTDKWGYSTFNMLQEIRAINDSTVEFILKYPYSAFPNSLATPNLATIVSINALKTSSRQFGQQPIGSGPFQFVRWGPDRRIVIKRFPKYWGKPTHLDSVIYQIIPSLEIKIQGLRNGQVDVISGLSAASVDQLYHTPSIHVVETLLPATAFLGFNCQTYPFAEAKLRHAVARVLDKKTMVASISRGLATVARGPLPPMVEGYDSTLFSPQFEPQTAKAELQSLGYANSTVVNLHYFIETDTLRANPMVQALKSNLEKLGLQVRVVAYRNWQVYEEAIRMGSKSQLFWGVGGSYTRHADNFLYPWFHSQSSNNVFKYKNPEVDLLLEQARRTSDTVQQRELYRKAQAIILQDCPAVFFSHPKAIYAIRKRVKNFKVDPLAIPWLHEVKLE
jgi:peptide/nickel transport system substrate-binding protein